MTTVQFISHATFCNSVRFMSTINTMLHGPCKIRQKNEKSKRVKCDMIKTVPVPFLQFSYAIKSFLKIKLNKA